MLKILKIFKSIPDIFKNLSSGDLPSKLAFWLTSLSVIIFTAFIIGSFMVAPRPIMEEHGFVAPIVYSEAIVYFPCSGELYAKSLSHYLKENNLEIGGMASKNDLWTKGYVVGVRPAKKLCVIDDNLVYFQEDNDKIRILKQKNK
jgi:hypothetical protein